MDPRSLLGLSDTGLGAISQNIDAGQAAVQARQLQELKRQQTLQDMMVQQSAENRLQQLQPGALQAQQLTNQGMQGTNLKQDLSNQETQALQPMKIAAAQQDQQLQSTMKLGQMAVQLAPALEKLPPQQRQQVLGQLGQKVPSLASNPVFQSLMQTDPRMLPNAMKQYGTNLMLQTQEQMQKLQASKQDNDAAMQRAQLAASTTLQANRENIAAGKYQKKQQGIASLMDIASKAGYEKAAVAATMFAHDKDNTKEEQDYYNSLAKQFHDANLEQRAASARPTVGIDPNTGNMVMQNPMASQYMQGPGGSGQSQQIQLPAGLPPGSQSNGDGTFTLPNGKRVKPKQ